MKVILSRKGMDSQTGGIPSPILPDGTLLSLPIPDSSSAKKYGDLYYQGQSLQEIIHQLKPRFDFSAYPTCHLDPDIYDEITEKPPCMETSLWTMGCVSNTFRQIGREYR